MKAIINVHVEGGLLCAELETLDLSGKNWGSHHGALVKILAVHEHSQLAEIWLEPPCPCRFKLCWRQ
jgi:hypothetical protein